MSASEGRRSSIQSPTFAPAGVRAAASATRATAAARRAGATRSPARRPRGALRVRRLHHAPGAVGGFGLPGRGTVGKPAKPALGLAHGGVPPHGPPPPAARQAIQRAAQARVDRSARQLEQPCDLARRVVEQVAQRDHRPVLRTELPQRRGQLVRQRLGRWVGRCRVLGRRGIDLAAQRPRARGVDRPVHDDPVQPGRERPPPIEAIERTDGRDEGLLGDVLGGRGVAHHDPGRAVGARPVPTEEQLERLGRAPLRLAHEPPFAEPRGGGEASGHASATRRGRQRCHLPVTDHARSGASHALHPKSLRAPARGGPDACESSAAPVAWVESHSLSFSARHDSSQSDEADRVLDALERFRDEVRGLFERTPGEVAVVLHPRSAALTLAHPWLPLARAGGRAREPPLLRRLVRGERDPRARARRRSSGAPRACPGSREALLLSPQHEYAHIVVGANNPDPAAAVLARELPPLRALGLAVRGSGDLARRPDPSPAAGDRAPAARGRPARVPARAPRRHAAGRHRLRAARAPGGPARPPPSSRRARSTAGRASLIAEAFGRQPPAVERDWRAELDSLRVELSRRALQSPASSR